jgi:hypothetical protein
MELNFSMFWGIAIMLYEATLISDDSPFEPGELSAAAQHGLTLFNNAPPVGAACRFCHVLPLGTEAAQFAGDPPFVTIQTIRRPNGLLDGAGNPVSTNPLRDIGFFPLGVSRVAEDVGAGGTDPYGDPLSFSRKSIEAGTPPWGDADDRRRVVQGAATLQRRAHAALFSQRRLLEPASGAGVLPARRPPPGR